jgi:methionyl-tRNA formyltransferase
VTPEPGAFGTIDGTRVKVLGTAIAREHPPIEPGAVRLRDGAVIVGTGTHPIELITVHPAGKRAMDAVAWWRGRSAGSADTFS